MTHLRATFHQIYWLVQHTPHIATCLVSSDKKSITIRGTPVLISDIPVWYQKLLVKAEEQLDKALCGLKFPKFEELLDLRLNPSKPRDAFVDNHNNRDVGYSFLTDERNGLREFDGVLLKAIFEDEELNKRFFVYDSDGNSYSRSGELVTFVAYLIHLTPKQERKWRGFKTSQI